MESASSFDRGYGDDLILRPRPMKPVNPIVLRAMGEDGGGNLKPSGHTAESQVSSGISRY